MTLQGSNKNSPGCSEKTCFLNGTRGTQTPPQTPFGGIFAFSAKIMTKALPRGF
jgi:hypothetical protein